jgi:hypothetical protein
VTTEVVSFAIQPAKSAARDNLINEVYVICTVMGELLSDPIQIQQNPVLMTTVSPTLMALTMPY